MEHGVKLMELNEDRKCSGISQNQLRPFDSSTFRANTATHPHYIRMSMRRSDAFWRAHKGPVHTRSSNVSLLNLSKNKLSNNRDQIDRGAECFPVYC